MLPADAMALGWGGSAALLAGLAKTGLPGAGILAVPLMALVFPARLSVGALLPLLIAADLFAVLFFRRHADWSRLLELAPPVALGLVAGAIGLHYLTDIYLKPVLGLLVLSLLALEGGRRRFGWTQAPHRPWVTGAIGAAAGFATMIGNVAGPIMSVYFIAKGLDKHRFMGTSAWFFCVLNLVKAPWYGWQGMITRETLTFDVWLLPAVAVGALAGRWLFERLSAAVFQALVLVLAGAAALRLVWL